MHNLDEIINQLTLEEKACLLSGHKSWHTNKVSRLNIPSIFLTDGPHGLRKKREDSKDVGLGETEPSTAFPPAVTSGSTWDKELLYKNMIAAEADWLYNLAAWKEIFDEDKLKALYKEQKSSTTIVKDEKVYPNDPCPCGSGKKYKKCCGKNK